MDAYQVAKDFLPAVITLIAAGTAAGITWRFSSRQAATAERQAALAHDRLRFDLFGKRYAIYEAAKSLLRMVINDRQKEGFRPFDVVPFLVIMDEAPFFFPPEACAIVEQIQQGAQALLEAHGLRDTTPIDDHAAWSQSARALSAQEKILADMLKAMPKLFEPVLSFPQLTASAAVRQA